ncbi:MAG: acetolactate synthase small subunit [Candidatus Melainabacteria bacterium]|jgi:acetolactate synthase-1/3 small subunit|nr:acetolactate synthase small subunit [Candidatus Melainabacteria bacterium]
MKRSVLSVLVENESGVLARISGLFSRRGYNIESLTVGPSEQEGLSRMIIVTQDDVEQVKKQLNKLINVIKITDLSELPYVDRELALIKVSSKQNRAEIIEIADLFRSRIIDVAEDSLVVEVTGDSEKINAVIQLILPFGIKEVARTGSVALLRGKKFN